MHGLLLLSMFSVLLRNSFSNENNWEGLKSCCFLFFVVFSSFFLLLFTFFAEAFPLLLEVIPLPFPVVEVEATLLVFGRSAFSFCTFVSTSESDANN